MIHAKDYKNSRSFRDKTVVVVGNAFSGVEIAADLAGSAKEVIHISSRPVWVLNRYLNGNIPLDLLFYQRSSLNHFDLKEEETHQAAHRKLSSFSRQQFISSLLDPLKEYGTQPPLLAISDTYLDLVKESKIKLQWGRVVSLDGRYIFLKNGEHVVADVVIFCTGYKNSLPFFDQKQRTTLQFEPSDQFLPLPLHKITFHPSFPNLAFVGMYRGPYFGIMELQARWAMLAFANPGRYYPSKEVMHAGIKDALKVRCLNPRPQFPYGDYIGLADGLAKEIGVYPDLEKLSARDREVIIRSPVIPSIYRFVGPFAHPDLAFDIVSECEVMMNHMKLKKKAA